MSKEIKHLVLEMCVGMFCYVLLLGVASLLFHEKLGFLLAPALVGLLAGFVADVLMLIHMAYTMERAADSMDAVYANKTTLIHGILRKVIFVIVLVFFGTRPQVNPVAMIIGALGLKAGAFLQPLVHRAFLRGADTN